MSKTNLEKFKETWKEEIKKIEDTVLDNRGSWIIHTNFVESFVDLVKTWEAGEFNANVRLEIKILESQLTRALEIARTKYKLQSHSLWVKFFESIADIVRGVPKPNRINLKSIKK